MDFLENPKPPSPKTAQYKAKAARYAAQRKFKIEVKQPPTGPRYPVRIIREG